ncbi:MAG: hypothetical protein U0L04_09155 [Bacteroidaceae bacterium]|nr:hypothetical protein [Bacteroidaceae bacterium]
MSFTFTISTAHAKELLHSWAFLTPEEEEAVLALEGPERTEMVHKLMAQNFLPGGLVFDIAKGICEPRENRDRVLFRIQDSWGGEWERQSGMWFMTEGKEVHKGAERAMKRINAMADANLKVNPEYRSLRAKLNRTRQQAKAAKAACKYCQKAQEKLDQLRTEVDDWSFPTVGPEALEAARLNRQMNFCSCKAKFEVKIEKLETAIRQLNLEETRKVLANAKDEFGIWKPEFTAPEPEPTEELDWGL